MNVLVPRTGALSKAFPAILQRAGKAACFAADEFFAAKISNPHTRRAYARPVGRFLAWCEAQGIELRQVTPGLAGRFIEDLPGSDPTKNLALAALRHFFDALVTRHAVALNPFASVRGRKYAVVDGKQREIPVRHDLDAWIAAYLEAGGIDLSPKAAPLFLAAERWGLGLTDRPMTAHGVRQMLKRRLHEAGRRPSRRTVFASWWSPTCWARTYPWRTCSTWPGTPIPRPPGSMTAAGGG